MNRTPHRLRLAPFSAVAALSFAALLSGCMASTAPAQPPAAPQDQPTRPPGTGASVPAAAAQVRSRWAAVEQEVGSAACTSTAQCRSIAVGAKACGGPERYLAWSTAVSDEARLRQRVEAYNTARQAENEQAGRISNCMMLMDPGANCSAGRCVTTLMGR